MQNLKRITDSTGLVLGDWVYTQPDMVGNTREYRLVAWSATTQRWLLFPDGLDPFVSGRPGMMMTPEDLQAKGFRKLDRLRTTRCMNAPVYLLQRTSPQVMTVLPAGTDPRAVA